MATYTVSGGGAALENCIRALPATATATNPHIIYVEPGVYSPVVLTAKATTHGAGWNCGSKRHIIIGANRDTCIVDGGGTDVCWQYQWNWGSQYSIYNMTFRHGIAKTYPAEYTTTAAVIQVGQNSGNENDCSKLINCKICDCVLPQLYTRDDGGTATGLVNSTLVHCTSLYNCEICNNTCTGTSVMIGAPILVGCNIHHNYYTCLNKAENLEAEGLNSQINGDGNGLTRSNRRERCIIHHNTSADSRSNAQSMIAAGGMNECIVAFNEYVGTATGPGLCYRCGFQSGNMPLTHCVFYGNTGFRYDNQSNGNYYQRFENCAIFNNTYPSGFCATAGGGQYGECYNNATDRTANFDTTGIRKFTFKGVSDPGFVDPQNLDFRLLPDSPLIGKGRSNIGQWIYRASSTPGSWYYDPQKYGDLAGRPFRETPAIGCFEYYDDLDPLLPILHPPMFFDPFG